MSRFGYRIINNEKKLGDVSRKILLLLSTGLLLGLTKRPDYYFRILKTSAREWQKINSRSLHRAIRRLYESKLLDVKENADGTTAVILSQEGKERVLIFDFENMRIKKPPRWDGLWRIVTFDIPESKKKGRDAISRKLRSIGMKPMQKSVFVTPYECRDEIDFISEMFDLKPFVRFIVVKDIDIALHLKKNFDLI